MSEEGGSCWQKILSAPRAAFCPGPQYPRLDKVLKKYMQVQSIWEIAIRPPLVVPLLLQRPGKKGGANVLFSEQTFGSPRAAFLLNCNLRGYRRKRWFHGDTPPSGQPLDSRVRLGRRYSNRNPWKAFVSSFRGTFLNIRFKIPLTRPAVLDGQARIGEPRVKRVNSRPHLLRLCFVCDGKLSFGKGKPPRGL